MIVFLPKIIAILLFLYMEFFKAWVVGLDMTPTDSFVLRNVAELARNFMPTHIHFVHVAPEPDIPEEVLKDIPDLQVPELTYYKSKVQKYVDENFDEGSNITIHIKKGNALTELLRTCDQLKSDLLIVGEKGSHSPGRVARKIVRKSPCSVLLVPEIFTKDINSVLVPTDFSDYSEKALKMSETIAERYEGCKIHALHVYKDASKYLSQVFETVHEIDEILLKRETINEKLTSYAGHKLEEYLAQFKNEKLTIFPHIKSIERGEEISNAIENWIENYNPDLVIIGAKGQSAAAAALLGQVSEQVYTKCNNHLMLIIKRKNENSSLLKVLLGS